MSGIVDRMVDTLRRRVLSVLSAEQAAAARLGEGPVLWIDMSVDGRTDVFVCGRYVANVLTPTEVLLVCETLGWNYDVNESAQWACFEKQLLFKHSLRVRNVEKA